MSFHITCTTRFDITETGVKNNLNQNRMPFVLADGTVVDTAEQWHKSRNQQRNWETINQLISLRVLPENITSPRIIDEDGKRTWKFEFTIDQADGLRSGDDPLGALLEDCRDVPMIIGLNENSGVESKILPGDNTCFFGKTE